MGSDCSGLSQLYEQKLLDLLVSVDDRQQLLGSSLLGKFSKNNPITNIQLIQLQAYKFSQFITVQVFKMTDFVFNGKKHIQIINDPKFDELIENYGKKNNFSSNGSNVNDKIKTIYRFKYHEYLNKQFNEQFDLLKSQLQYNINSNQRSIENEQNRNSPQREMLRQDESLKKKEQNLIERQKYVQIRFTTVQQKQKQVQNNIRKLQSKQRQFQSSKKQFQKNKRQFEQRQKKGNQTQERPIFDTDYTILREKLYEYQSQIKQLKYQKSQVEKKVQAFQIQRSQKETQIQVLAYQFKQKEQKYKKLEKELEQIKKDLNKKRRDSEFSTLNKNSQQGLKAKIKDLERQRENTNFQLSELKQKYRNLLNKVQGKDKDRIRKDRDEENLGNKIINLQNQLKRKDEQYFMISNKSERIEKELRQLNEKYKKIENQKMLIIRQKQSQVAELQRQLQRIRSTSNQQQLNKREYQKRIEQIQSKKAIMQRELNQKSTSIKRLEQKIQQLSRPSKSQKDLEGLKVKCAQLQKRLKDRQTQNYNLNRQIEEIKFDKKTATQKLQTGIDNMKYKYNELDNQYRLLIQDNKVLKENSRSYAQYFNGDILNTHNSEYTQWLAVLLEKMYKKISRTNLLYRFDTQNPTSFHKYIDEQPFIVIFVKLKNGNIVGGFSQEPIKRFHNTENKPGFLFNLNMKKHFQLKDQRDTQDNVAPSPIIWNDYFIMFGNAELRIRFGQNFVFSNFGGNSGYFDSKGLSVRDFLGKDAQNTKQADFITYELFSIIFQK